MGKIFISYRREDSADSTGRIFDRLVSRFGAANLVRDVDSIPFGVDFREYLAGAVSECSILLAVIGKNWMDAKDQTGRRRLDDPRDFVRVEIETALQRGIPIIPVIVQGATFPDPNQLPPTLKNLTFRNGLQVRPDPDFRGDADRLTQILEGILGTAKSSPHRWLLAGIIGGALALFVMVLVGVAAMYALSRFAAQPAPPSPPPIKATQPDAPPGWGTRNPEPNGPGMSDPHWGEKDQAFEPEKYRDPLFWRYPGHTNNRPGTPIPGQNGGWVGGSTVEGWADSQGRPALSGTPGTWTYDGPHANNTATFKPLRK